MAGTLTVDTIQSDSSYASTLNVASKVNFAAGMQIGGQDTTFGGMRNRIINGAMVIDQRNAGAAVTIDGGAVFTIDRWQVEDGSDAVLSAQQSTDVPTGQGFVNSLKVTVTTADSVIGATQYDVITHYIEGYNAADLMFGTAAAQPVTLSFWVKSSLAGQYSATLVNNGGSRINPQAFTINAANTWEKKTITYVGDTTGTWLTTNGRGLTLQIFLAEGSNYVGSAGWNGSTIYAVTGQVNFVGTLNNAIYLTGVQLEKGSAATAFEYRQYGTELALCQRYYWQAIKGDSQELTVGWYFSTTQISLVMNMPVPMRTGPSISQVTGTNYYAIYSAGGTDSFNSLTVENAGTTMVSLLNSTQVSGTAGYSGIVRATNASAYLGFTAEL